jgi:hypothetical protein
MKLNAGKKRGFIFLALIMILCFLPQISRPAKATAVDLSGLAINGSGHSASVTNNGITFTVYDAANNLPNAEYSVSDSYLYVSNTYDGTGVDYVTFETNPSRLFSAISIEIAPYTGTADIRIYGLTGAGDIIGNGIELNNVSSSSTETVDLSADRDFYAISKLQILVTSGSANKSFVIKNLSLDMDTTSPTVTLTSALTAGGDALVNTEEKAAGFDVVAKSDDADSYLYVVPAGTAHDVGSITTASIGSTGSVGANTDTTISIPPNSTGVIDGTDYMVYAIDWFGNVSTISGVAFTADLTAPAVGGAANNGKYKVDVAATFTEGAAALEKDGGDADSYMTGTTLSAEGSYVLTVTDAAGNSTVVNFLIDKTAPVITGVTNGGQYNTRQSPTFNEGTATISANGGAPVAFTSGDVISVVGRYVLTVTDDANNSTTVEFTLWNTAPAVPADIPTVAGNVSPAVVEVNGQQRDVGVVDTQKDGGRTITTITVDENKLNNILEISSNNATISLSAPSGTNVFIGEINGQSVKNMEQKEAVLEIKTSNSTYVLPTTQINIDDVSNRIGAASELKDIKVSVRIDEASSDTLSIVENTASRNNFQVIANPVDFGITCTYGDKTIDVNRFSGYVERTIALPAGVDPSKIMTGVVLNSDGTFSHVPTIITVLDGKYYAKLNSLTNSTYTVICNSGAFTDVANHWAKDAVNDMGARLVITGTDGTNFEPDRDITRAEFAAIIVRALGLKPGLGTNDFGDVKDNDWYCGYIETAAAYKLIEGLEDGSFHPTDRITREQAMTIISRAMVTTNMRINMNGNEIGTLLGGYDDGLDVSDWAASGTAACVKAGIVGGRTETTLNPKEHITRAEVAVIIQRLLQKSNLI